MTPRQYDLFLTRSQKWQVALPLVLFTVFPLIFLIAFSSAAFQELRVQDPLFPYFPLLFFFGFAAVYAWALLSLPYRISVTHEQMIVFKSLMRSRSVRASELVSIEPGHLYIQANISGYVLKHENGKIRFPGQFTGQYMLLHDLKQANPRLEIKGC